MKSMDKGQSSSSQPIDARAMRIAVVESLYHHDVCRALAAGAVDAFVAAGGDAGSVVLVESPGAFELTAIALALAERSDIDAVVALGCVLTGETSHDRYICDAVAHGLTNVTLRTGKPVAFGILTCITIEQARARSGGSKGNKGVEAMHAAIRATRTIGEIRAAESVSAGARR